MRESILKGDITLPNQIIELVGEQHAKEMTAMFNAIVRAFVKNEGNVSAPYWSDRFNNNKVFNKFIMHLSKAGWITTKVEPNRNWAEMSLNKDKLLKWLTPEEITGMRERVKVHQYLLQSSGIKTPKLTRTPKGEMSVGHVRNGISKHSCTEFRLDTNMMVKYKEAIILNTTKGIRTLKLEHELFTDKAHYEAIAGACINYYIENPEKSYVLGSAISDSRGRAIYSCTGKVFNPIGFKDARSLLVTPPKSLNKRGKERIILAIAELLGDKSKSIEAKMQVGINALENRTLLTIDLSTEKGRKYLHNNMWLERIYANWESYPVTREWTVPIEMDQSASMLQIEGVLLNSKELTSLTNLQESDDITDPWHVDGLSRDHVKKFMTPNLYGSSKTPGELWTSNGLSFTMDDIRVINKTITKGPYAIANKFKEFIVENVNPKPEMEVTVWNEKFTIYCNRYTQRGEVPKRYDVYNSNKEMVQTIYHTKTVEEPNLEAFKRYFVTLLVHGIDSQVMDRIAQSISWTIPIFDAVITHPSDAMMVEHIFISCMKEIHSDRKEVLSKYFKSIGITSSAAMHWKKVVDLITPITEFKPSTISLK